MKRLILTLLMLSVAGTAVAGPAMTMLEQLITSTEISAGVRWEPERYQPLDSERAAFYIGGEMRLSLSTRAELFGAFDRDFTDAPRWQARAGIAFQPFSR